MTGGSECGSTHEKNLCLQMRKSRRRQEASVFGSTSVRRVISLTCGLGPLRSEVRVPWGSCPTCQHQLLRASLGVLSSQEDLALTNLGQPRGDFGKKRHDVNSRRPQTWPSLVFNLVCEADDLTSSGLGTPSAAFLRCATAPRWRAASATQRVDQRKICNLLASHDLAGFHDPTVCLGGPDQICGKRRPARFYDTRSG